jgi:tetratricopeptide (TPR) repeat protein
MRRAYTAGAGTLALALAIFGAGALKPSLPAENEHPGRLREPTSSSLFGPQPVRHLGATISSLQRRLRSREDSRSLALLGLAYLQKGARSADPTFYDRAEAALERSLDITEKPSFEAALGMGVLSNARHHFAAALRWGKVATSANPFNAEARGVVGDALTELGEYGRAARAVQRMVDLRPGLSAYARVSYARELRGDIDGAINALKLAYNAAGHPADRAWAAYHLGELHFGRGRLAAAAHAYRLAAHLAPGYALAHAGRAKVAAARGRVDEAISSLTPVARDHPSPEVAILLGDLLHLDGRAAAARRQYALVAAIQRLYRASGVNVDLELALFEADHGNNPKQALARALAEYRRRPSVHVADALAWTLYANKRFAAARRYAGVALRLGTRSALFHFHAGMIEYRLGHPGPARDHLERALANNPSFSFFHAARARRTLDRLLDVAA